MGKAPAFQFYVKDWLSDTQLKMASFSTKGIWIDILCYMWVAPDRGELVGTKESFMRLLGANNSEIDLFFKEAQALRFCYVVTDHNKNITLRNRRMYNEDKEKENNRLRQQRYRDKHKDNAEITPPSPTASPSATPKHINKASYRRQDIPYGKIVSYLNEKIKKNYRPTTKETQKHIRARFNEGFTEQDFYTVIDNMASKWFTDPKMVDYLRPKTLFGPNFESYLNSSGGKDAKADLLRKLEAVDNGL
jgi:uncharacterized phage protein (TIGR02220 family)